MDLIEWDEELVCGIDLIDEQHKEFITQANLFFIRKDLHKNFDAASKSLDFLEHYLLYHFQAEEAFQVDKGFPEYRAHQATHSMLKMQVKGMSVQMKKHNFSQEVVDELHQFILTWVKAHIMTEDMAFSKFVNQKEALEEKLD